MSDNFWDKVSERAYFNYLERENNHITGDDLQDWDSAYRDQEIEERIKEEAYLHYLNGNNNSEANWIAAKNEIIARLNFLAFFNHEANINKSPLENWIEAQKLYLTRF